MSIKKKKGLSIGDVLGFIAAAVTAIYALLLFTYFDESIRYDLIVLIEAHGGVLHMLFVVASIVFAVISLLARKRLCMLIAGVLLGVSALFKLDYAGYIVLPAILIFSAFAEMD